MLLEPVFQACDAANVDATTGVCSVPYWAPQPGLIPQLDMQAGVTIGTAILLCWTVAYGYKALRRVAE